MRFQETAQTVTLTSPSSASTAIGATLFKGNMFQRAEKLVIDAQLVGGAGGTLDVYLQRKIASDTWRDWVHFPQVAAGATKYYTVTIKGEGVTIVDVGYGADASATPSLTANTAVDVIPGGDVRVVFVAGAGTSAGASNSVTITPYTERRG